MIIVRISQGLGNQMFQYAFGECLKKKYNMDVIYDTSFIAKKISGRKMREINDIFKNEFKIATFSQIRRYTGRVIFNIPIIYEIISNNEKEFGIINSLLWKARIKTKTVLIQEPEYWDVSEDYIRHILELKLDTSQNYYFNGFWESIKYIENNRKFLQEIFSIRIPSTEKTENYIRQIQCKNTVSIHIRRGDYVTKSNDDIKFNICDKKYYEKAIIKIKELIDNPKFVIFSDDIEYAQKMLESEKDCIFVTGEKDFEDLFLMSICNHNIIANSTFSFWGAFLNKNVDQIVIAPQTQYVKNVNGRWKDIKLPTLSEWITLQNWG